MGFNSLEIIIKILSVKKLPCRARSHEKVQNPISCLETNLKAL